MCCVRYKTIVGFEIEIDFSVVTVNAAGNESLRWSVADFFYKPVIGTYLKTFAPAIPRVLAPPTIAVAVNPSKDSGRERP